MTIATLMSECALYWVSLRSCLRDDVFPTSRA